MAVPEQGVQNQQPKLMTINKTDSQYRLKSLRFLLLTVNTMCIVAGALMIGMGISVYSHFQTFTYLVESIRSGRFMTPVVLCVFLGFLLLVVALFGFFGTLKKNTSMINLFALILMGMMIAKLVVGILLFNMNSFNLSKIIDIPVSLYGIDQEVQDEIDFMQRTMFCCGGDSYKDYANVDFNPNQSTMNMSDPFLGLIEVPSTCCPWPIGCMIHRPGCKQSLGNIVVKNSINLGVLCVSVMSIELIGFVFALFYARCIRREKSVSAMVAWKIKEDHIQTPTTEKQDGLYEKKLTALQFYNNELNVVKHTTA